MRSVWRSGVWFTIVGVLATLTHVAVFALALRHTGMAPEIANGLGFMVAFSVSFTGHRAISFAGGRAGLSQSLVRYALTALAGFVCNEAVFVVALRLLGWPTALALGAALALAAVQTFLLSRYWVFRA